MKKIILLVAFFATTAQAQLQVSKDATTFVFSIQAKDATTGENKTDVSSWTCKRSINGGASATCTGVATEQSDTDQPGLWNYVPSAAETANAGTVVFTFTATGTAPFQKEIQVGGVPLADASIKPATYLSRGTAQGVTSTTIQLAASEGFAGPTASSPAGDLENACVYIVSASTGAGQYRPIISYDGATDTATVKTWGTLPTGTIVYDLFPCVGSTSTSGAGHNGQR